MNTTARIQQGFTIALCLATLCCATEADDCAGMGRNPKERISIRTDAERSVRNFTRFISAPLHMDKASYVVAGSLIGMTALGSAGDRSIRHEAREETQNRMVGIISPWQFYGFSYIPSAIAASVYIGGLGFSNDWLRETGRECLVSLACAALVTSSLKVTLGRERPNQNEGPFDSDPLSFRYENQSFPSAHTTLAFTLSTVLASRIRNQFASIALYGAACMTAAQRVFSDSHWFTDVAAGAMIGTSSALFIVHDSEHSHAPLGHFPLHVAPFITGSGAGIGISQAF
jgi:hypothetical protein